jgi:hypothetical protein
MSGVSPLGRTAKNSPQALTSELPPVTDMVRPRGNASAAKPLRATSGHNSLLFFLEKIRRWAARDRAPRTQRRSRWSDGRMVDGRRRVIGATRARCSRAFKVRTAAAHQRERRVADPGAAVSSLEGRDGANERVVLAGRLRHTSRVHSRRLRRQAGHRRARFSAAAMIGRATAKPT